MEGEKWELLNLWELISSWDKFIVSINLSGNCLFISYSANRGQFSREKQCKIFSGKKQKDNLKKSFYKIAYSGQQCL